MPEQVADVEVGLSDWLDSTKELREALSAFGKSPLPMDAGERHAEFDRLIQNESDALTLLADSESYLSQATAQAVLAMKDRHPDVSAREREILVKASVRDLQRLTDGLSITARIIANRRFIAMNANRSQA